MLLKLGLSKSATVQIAELGEIISIIRFKIFKKYHLKPLIILDNVKIITSYMEQ